MFAPFHPKEKKMGTTEHPQQAQLWLFAMCGTGIGGLVRLDEACPICLSVFCPRHAFGCRSAALPCVQSPPALLQPDTPAHTAVLLRVLHTQAS